jgi:DNA-binding CsgD family transcriptional regulator
MKIAESEAVVKSVKLRPITVDRGLVLLNLSLELIGCDSGALSILNDTNQSGGGAEPAHRLPEEVMDFVRRRKPSDWSSATMSFFDGESEYICRAHLIESQIGYLSQAIVGIHLERVSCPREAIAEVAMKYRLTEREREVLQGISIGLSNKEMADRMHISPNTVRAFVRLIMTKMRVSRRAAIVVGVLQNRPSFDEDITLPPQTWQSSESGRFQPALKATAAAGSLDRPKTRSSPDSTTRADSLPRI